MADSNTETQEKAPEVGAPKKDLAPYHTTKAEVDHSLPEPKEALLSWKGSGLTEGKSLSYTARAAHIPVYSDAGELISNMFSLSYVVSDEKKNELAHASALPEPNVRPVTFAFNGGPGCASVPVNFGGMGPTKIKVDGLNHLTTPVETEDNPYTLLTMSDLVFLDAPGTGYSTLAEGMSEEKTFGIDADAECFARAISQWLEDNQRWDSPVYLFGESYGTVRNAVLARILGEHAVQVAGIVMLSALFDWFQVLEVEDLYHIGMFPTFAAAAHHFKKAGQDVDLHEHFDKAMAYAEDVLAPALLKGDRLDQAVAEKIAEEMEGFIGIPKSYILARRFRITLEDFRAKLLEAEGKTIGRLDMRFVSDAPHALQRNMDFVAMEDASSDANSANMQTAFRTFLTRTLGYKGPARYLDMNYMHIGSKWKFEHMQPGVGGSPMPNVAFDLSLALKRNAKTKLAILGGRFDAATTWYNVVHDMSCQYLSDEVKERIVWHLYDCGHMAYIDMPTLEQMYQDLEKFYSL